MLTTRFARLNGELVEALGLIPDVLAAAKAVYGKPYCLVKRACFQLHRMLKSVPIPERNPALLHAEQDSIFAFYSPRLGLARPQFCGASSVNRMTIPRPTALDCGDSPLLELAHPALAFGCVG